MTIRVLTLCTGNICRSPLAAQILALRLDVSIIETASAGTSAMVGAHMPEPLQTIATRMGAIDANKHRGVAVTKGVLARSDLVLGMEREHRQQAAKLQPQVVRKAFTLLEFSHVVQHIGQDQLAAELQQATDGPEAALALVMRMRGVVPRLTPARRYDLDDPYGRSNQVYERSAQRIEKAVDQIANFFQQADQLVRTP